MATQLPIILKGFTVRIDQTAGLQARPDAAWETCTGGALNIEIQARSTGADPQHVTSPGHKYIDEITLRGPMTPERKDITQWIMDTVRGTNPRRNVIVTEILVDGHSGKSYAYQNCFITRVVFPRLDAAGTGNLYEEVSIKPERLEFL